MKTTVLTEGSILFRNIRPRRQFAGQKKLFQSFLLFFLQAFFISCVSVSSPEREYAIAFSALEDAEVFSADSPSSYSKARRFYQKGVSMYRRGEYGEAKSLFSKSIRFSEKTELRGRIKEAREIEE